MTAEFSPLRTEIAELARRDRFDAVLRVAAGLAETQGAGHWFAQGAAALKRNDAFGAVAAFEAAAAADPQFPALAEALASAYRRDARYDDCLRVTANADSRQCRFERAMSLLALGEGQAALTLFDHILANDPDHAASWFTSHAPALELSGLPEAQRRLRRAVACSGANGRYWAYLAAYGLLTEDDAVNDLIAEQITPYPARQALVDGVRALLPHCPVPPALFGVSASLLRFALAQAHVAGLVLEFGVRRGTSITVLANAAGQQVHGFDSFEGLPQSWGAEPAGTLTTGAVLPSVPANVVLYAGWFENTLDCFLATHEGAVRLVNVDSDIYSSAHFVLDRLKGRIVPGSVLVFDEFIGNRTWAEDEFKAFSEFAAQTGVTWRVLALAPFTKQVAIVIEEA